MKFKTNSVLAGVGAAARAAAAGAGAGPGRRDAGSGGQPPKLDTGDTAWMLTSTALVLMMTIPGLALFYGGMVRKKNVLATVMQSFAITCLITVLWLVVGYSLAFTPGSTDRRRPEPHLPVAASRSTACTISPRRFPKSVFMCFQMTFAIITPALIAGAFAERMKFSAMMWFMALWSLIVYAPIAHWVWGGGFLGDWGVLDFAGGTVVHINAGVAGLVCALVLGKRKGFGTENMAPHNLVYSVIGAVAAVGRLVRLQRRLGGRRQRQRRHGDGGDADRRGRGGAGLDVRGVGDARQAVGARHHLGRGRPASSPSRRPRASSTPMGALVIGIVAGVVCFWGATGLKKALGYDDSLDAFGVHGVGGFVGAILTGVFAVEAIGGEGKKGLIDGNAGQVLTQLWGSLVCIAWCAVATFIILKIVDALIGLRVTTEEEIEGLDINLHGETVH